MKADYYEYEFNASQFLSEVYFYGIKASDPSISPHYGQAGQSFVETKKMIVIK